MGVSKGSESSLVSSQGRKAKSVIRGQENSLLSNGQPNTDNEYYQRSQNTRNEKIHIQPNNNNHYYQTIEE